MPEVKPLREGLQEAFEWYGNNKNKVNRKDYMEYIDINLAKE